MADTLDRMLRRSRKTLQKPAVPMNTLQMATRNDLLRKYSDGTYLTVEVSCLCGASDGRMVAEFDRYGLPSPSLVCRACGVVRTSPRLTEDSLAYFYDNEYRPLYAGSDVAQENFLKLQVARGTNIRHFLRGLLPPNSRVMDLGCGSGWTLLPFRDAGHRVSGCDPGSSYLEAGIKLGLDLRHGDHTSLTDVAPFDLVIMSHVFEHITDPGRLMSDIKPLLAQRGLVYLEVPGLRAIPTSFGDPLRYFQNAHLWSFDLGSLTAVMGSYGYRLLKGDQYIRSVFTPDDTAVPLDRGGYGRAVRALSRAEALRHISEGRLKVKGALQAILGTERASKLKRALTR